MWQEVFYQETFDYYHQNIKAVNIVVRRDFYAELSYAAIRHISP